MAQFEIWSSGLIGIPFGGQRLTRHKYGNSFFIRRNRQHVREMIREMDCIFAIWPEPPAFTISQHPYFAIEEGFIDLWHELGQRLSCHFKGIGVNRSADRNGLI